ncbi:MAG: amino acid ABC transporter substrate-binding protein [Alphaproteobacteria bacterium]|nr:MAG: amino acid ABC transporter substrate-binding protein [Alphaproteobacteria bacterium]
MRLTRGLLAALAVLLFWPIPASAQSTLDQVRKRGELVCGVDGSAPGFSLLNAVKEWEGLDVELCRAVAAAVLGDAQKVKFVTVTANERFDRLAAGDFDLLARNSTVTLQRSAGRKVRFAVINFIDGQAFVVPKKLKVEQLANLSGTTICLQKGTTHEFNLASWFKARRLTITPAAYDTTEAMYNAFFASRCSAVTADATTLAGAIIRSGRAIEFMMLPGVISKEPLGPYVREGDSQWLDIVRWTHDAMLEAEERGINPKNIDSLKRELGDPYLRVLLGVDPGNGKALGLSENWAYNVISQVGNYGDIYERNVGMGSALKFERGVNALWTKGGLMYPLPLR